MLTFFSPVLLTLTIKLLFASFASSCSSSFILTLLGFLVNDLVVFRIFFTLPSSCLSTSTFSVTWSSNLTSSLPTVPFTLFICSTRSFALMSFTITFSFILTDLLFLFRFIKFLPSLDRLTDLCSLRLPVFNRLSFSTATFSSSSSSFLRLISANCCSNLLTSSPVGS